MDPIDLQGNQLIGKRRAFRRQGEKAFSPIRLASLLDDKSLIDQLFQNPRETLLGNFENIKEIGDAQAGVPVDEMQHPMVSTTKPEFGKDDVGFASKVPVSEIE